MDIREIISVKEKLESLILSQVENFLFELHSIGYPVPTLDGPLADSTTIERISFDADSIVVSFDTIFSGTLAVDHNDISYPVDLVNSLNRNEIADYVINLNKIKEK